MGDRICETGGLNPSTSIHWLQKGSMWHQLGTLLTICGAREATEAAKPIDSHLLRVTFASCLRQIGRSYRRSPPICGRCVIHASLCEARQYCCLAHKLTTPLTVSVHHANSVRGPRITHGEGQARLSWESTETRLSLIDPVPSLRR